MKVLLAAGIAGAFLVGPSVIAEAAVIPYANPTVSLNGPGPLKWTDDWTGVKVTPFRPRQDSDVRILVRCPKRSTNAIVAAKPFNPPGSRKFRRQKGIGITDGRGFDTETVAYDALRGPRRVTLRCLKITVDEKTRHRTIELVSRSHTHIFVRKFRPGRF
jgi:hypothetical protein